MGPEQHAITGHLAPALRLQRPGQPAAEQCTQRVGRKAEDMRPGENPGAVFVADDLSKARLLDGKEGPDFPARSLVDQRCAVRSTLTTS